MTGISVIIPTYNESENVVNMIDILEDVLTKSSIKFEIVVVDDDSPDGTADIARKKQELYNNLKVIVRTTDKGLSQAVVEGFNHCSHEIISVIDCDFSHPPELLPVFFNKIEDGCDVVFGTRYAGSGEIQGWGLKRKLISRGATLLANILVGGSTDPVSGFFMMKKSVVSGSDLKPRGYKIGLEILGKGNWNKYCEIPYVFRNREVGESKLGIKEIVDYIFQLFDIAAYKIKNMNS
ncbi:Glycosyltransferase involved in cell wall bisynthesis [Methanolobus vulcani]|uniref:Glycosyltransferase involved in cell wall bisynthesis n=1 Tax=Methanolobus vulcani TaxID=38026 RepID=A0A7Z7AYK0_9EURY|nr:polyprenol monophosphomannose synthase [Methanolobus vulcani]SDF58589.1 Glycosyltransferase involved in cell wall bisynthesis [Methanolobus vulcani]